MPTFTFEGIDGKTYSFPLSLPSKELLAEDILAEQIERFHQLSDLIREAKKYHGDNLTEELKVKAGEKILKAHSVLIDFLITDFHKAYPSIFQDDFDPIVGFSNEGKLKFLRLVNKKTIELFNKFSHDLEETQSNAISQSFVRELGAKNSRASNSKPIVTNKTRNNTNISEQSTS